MLIKEETEEPQTNESTQVENFPNVSGIDDGSDWDEELAKNVFYQFIMPTTRPQVYQKHVQDGLIPWISDRSNWGDTELTFNKGTFDTINKRVLNELLNTSILDLMEDPEKWVTNYKYTDKEGNEKTIPFGYNLSNPKGFSITDDPESDLQKKQSYKEWLRVISSGKTELEALKAMGWSNTELKESSSFKIAKLRKDIEEAESIVEEMKNYTFDDTITLQEVVNNTDKSHRFYMRMSFDPKDKKAAVALGNLIGEEYIKWEENKDVFENTFGVSWQDYTTERKKLNDFKKNFGIYFK